MDHAVVLSADMEASRRVWGDVIGARLALDRTFPERNTRILFFRLADITIEISGGATQSKEGVGKPDRMWGIAWGVDSIEATCARLAAAGIETSGPRPGIKPGTLIATVKGPQAHGVATLLIEHTPESFRPESREPHGAAFDNAPQARAFNAARRSTTSSIVDDRPRGDGREVGRRRSGCTVSDTAIDRATRAGFRMAKLPAGNAFVELVAAAHAPTAASRRRSPTAARACSRSRSRSTTSTPRSRDLRAKGVLVSDPAPGAWPGTRIARSTEQAANGVSTPAPPAA